MAISFEELNLVEIFQDLARICKTEKVCGTCAQRDCLVGYSRDSLAQCRINKTTYVPDGMKNMPHYDIRGGYDEYEVLHAMSHLLLQCKACKENHYDSCIINVIRSCMEVILFGDPQEFRGIPLQYMMALSQEHPDQAATISEEYMRKKDEQQ